jgi:hypothetical protein
MNRQQTYITTLELENEILRDKVKALQAQLKPYLDAEIKREEYLKKRDEIDVKLAEMLGNFHNKMK